MLTLVTKPGSVKMFLVLSVLYQTYGIVTLILYQFLKTIVHYYLEVQTSKWNKVSFVHDTYILSRRVWVI